MPFDERFTRRNQAANIRSLAKDIERRRLPDHLKHTLIRHAAYLSGRKGGQVAFLKNYELRDLDLSKLELQEAVMEAARMSCCDLSETNLSRADLFAANMHHCNLSNAILERADLRGANLTEAILTGANLQGADMRPGTLLNSGFQQVRPTEMGNANFDGVDFSGARMEDGHMVGVSMVDVTADDTDFSATVLTGADLSRARLKGANFKRAVLKGVLLEDADLCDANLEGADLRGVDVSNARLEGAELSNANIFLSMLYMPDQMQKVLREHFQWLTSKGKRGKCASFKDLDLEGIDFSQADLSMADFTGANLRGATFKRSVLCAAKFNGAHLEDALFLDADARGATFTGAFLNHARALNTDFGNLTVRLTTEKGRTKKIFCDFLGAEMGDMKCRNCNFKGANQENNQIPGQTGSVR